MHESGDNCNKQIVIDLSDFVPLFQYYKTKHYVSLYFTDEENDIDEEIYLELTNITYGWHFLGVTYSQWENGTLQLYTLDNWVSLPLYMGISGEEKLCCRT